MELNICFEFILDKKSKTFISDFFLVYREEFFSSIFQSQNKIMFVFWPLLAPNIAPHPKHKISVFLNMLV